MCDGVVIAAALSVIELAGALALFGGVIVTLFTIAEKVTGIGQRWLARGVEQGIAPLAAKVDSTRADVNDVKADLKEHRAYTRYHLGPNGESPRLHDRVERIERRVEAVSHEQAQVRHDLEDRGVPPVVDWNGPYDDEERR